MCVCGNFAIVQILPYSAKSIEIYIRANLAETWRRRMEFCKIYIQLANTHTHIAHVLHAGTETDNAWKAHVEKIAIEYIYIELGVCICGWKEWFSNGESMRRHYKNYIYVSISVAMAAAWKSCVVPYRTRRLTSYIPKSHCLNILPMQTAGNGPGELWQARPRSKRLRESFEANVESVYRHRQHTHMPRASRHYYKMPSR